MKTMKKILCTMLVVVMCLTSAPLQGFVGLEIPIFTLAEASNAAVVDSGNCGDSGDNVTWTLYGDGTFIVSGKGNMKDYSWYSSYNTTPYWGYRNQIVHVIIEEGVTSVGSMSFERCSKILSVTLADSVTRIGGGAFGHCYYISDIIIPQKVTTIEDSAFRYCLGLTNVIIPEGVTNIGSLSFAWCENLKKVTIPASVTYIGTEAFNHIPVTPEFYYSGTQKQWENINIDLYNDYFANATIHYNYKPALKIYTGEFYSGPYVYGGTDKYEGYRYMDDYFKDSNANYNHELAKMSMCVAMSAFNSKDSVGGTYYEDQDINIRYILNEIGYNVKTYYYDEKPHADSIAFAIGQKDIVIENEEYTVIVIAVRGSGYEAEWGGNFRVGNGTNHKGFEIAKNTVIKHLKEYLATTEVNHKIKFWLTGYSRAAATANLAAVEIINDNIGGVTESDVYAYTFETPQNTKSQNAKSWKYDGIHNIVNPIDFVPKVAMSAWNFKRYGQDHFIPASETSRNYNKLYKSMLKVYKNINKFDCPYIFEPKTLKVDLFTTTIVNDKDSNMQQTRFLDRFYNMLVINTIQTPERYAEELEETVVKIISGLYVEEGEINNFILGLQDVLLEFLASHKVKVTEYLIKGVVAGNNTIIKLLLDDKSVMENLKVDLAKYMSSTDYLDLSYSEAKTFVNDCEDILYLLGVYMFDDVLTLICNFENAIAESHQPRLCLSWMNTLQSEEDFSTGTYKTFVYNCPVDIYVYDSEERLVAAIIDDIPQDIEGSYLSCYVNEHGEKVFCLPDNEYRIETIATDDGLLSCSVSEDMIESYFSIGKVQFTRDYTG